VTLLVSPASLMAGENCWQTPIDSAAASVRVFVINDARAPVNLLHRVEAEVSRIFDAIGVVVLWAPAWPCDGRHPLIVRLAAREMPETLVSPSTLGITPSASEGQGTLAYVFYARVVQASQKYSASVDKVLAVTIVHELGHMLLPYGSHAKSGVMSAQWDQSHFRLASFGLLLFTPDAAALIRSGLGR
jgi:hypothetical protein